MPKYVCGMDVRLCAVYDCDSETEANERYAQFVRKYVAYSDVYFESEENRRCEIADVNYDSANAVNIGD